MHRIIISREKKGLGVPAAAGLIKKAALAALAAEGIDADCEINVLLTDDEGIREINSGFRGVDAPTDVLSFPQFELKPGGFELRDAPSDPGTGAVPLGDVALSLPQCVKQGGELGHGTGRELMYLCVHSVLHLLGYDHLDEGEMKKRMRDREKAIMRKLATS